MKRKMEDHTAYRKLYQEAISTYKPEYIIGLDEVGWGSIAGSLGLGCAVYRADYVNSKLKIRDSKKYSTSKAREKAFFQVKGTARYTKYLSIPVGESLASDMALFIGSLQR
jgi:ribonuclease HII